MSDNEINSFLALLEKEKKAAVRRTKTESEAFLKKVGILTPSGNVAKPFQSICTPKGQA